MVANRCGDRDDGVYQRDRSFTYRDAGRNVGGRVDYGVRRQVQVLDSPMHQFPCSGPTQGEHIVRRVDALEIVNVSYLAHVPTDEAVRRNLSVIDNSDNGVGFAGLTRDSFVGGKYIAGMATAADQNNPFLHRSDSIFAASEKQQLRSAVEGNPATESIVVEVEQRVIDNPDFAVELGQEYDLAQWE